MKTNSRNLIFLTLILSLSAVHATITLTAADTFSSPSGSIPGNLAITGDLSIYKGLDVGTTVIGSTTYSAINIDWYNTALLPKTASFDITDANATFQWRDNLAAEAAVRNKMTLDPENILSLYDAAGAAANITLSGNTGVINLVGSGSGITANGTPLFSLDSAGKVNFSNSGTFQNTNPTPSSSPTTGALTLAGGVGVLGSINTAGDSSFNGVRVGTGSGTGAAFAGQQGGKWSTAVGDLALASNQTGVWNTAMGYRALNSNTSGHMNTAIGFDVLSSLSIGSGNCALGMSAGSLTSYAVNSIFIGYSSKGSNNGDNSNTIVIGAGASGEGSNTTVIGNTATTKTHLFGTTYSDGLAVSGSSYLSHTAVVLLNLPVGVTGSYYGPQRTGRNFYQHDFVFGKNGDEITGDFTVPLGTFSNRGSDITVDISTPGNDPDSGSAHFVLAGKRITSESDPLVATEYHAFGGAADIELRGRSLAGSTSLFIKFNAKNVSPGQIAGHTIQVKVRYLGDTAYPQDRSNTFESVYPVAKVDSTNRPNGGTTTKTITAAEIILDGKVTITQPQGDIPMFTGQ